MGWDIIKYPSWPRMLWTGWDLAGTDGNWRGFGWSQRGERMVMVKLPSQFVSEALRICCGITWSCEGWRGTPQGVQVPWGEGTALGRPNGKNRKNFRVLSAFIVSHDFSFSWCRITEYVQSSASSSANLFSLSVGAFGSWVPVSVLHFRSYCCHISYFYFYFSR